jgi:hypothetical protein
LNSCTSKEPTMYQVRAKFPEKLFSDFVYMNMGDVNCSVAFVEDEIGIFILTVQRKFAPSNRRQMAILGYSLMSGELIFHHSGFMVPPIISSKGIIVQSEDDLKHKIESFRFD